MPTAKRPPSGTEAPCAGHNVDNESVDADNENLRTQFIARRLSIRIDHAGFGLNRPDRLIDPSSRLSGKHYTVKIDRETLWKVLRHYADLRKENIMQAMMSGSFEFKTGVAESASHADLFLFLLVSRHRQDNGEE